MNSYYILMGVMKGQKCVATEEKRQDYILIN
jgi:hypothetical protein